MMNYDKKIIIWFSILITMIFGVFSLAYLSSEKSLYITVEDKERINHKNFSYYLVYSDNGVFKIEDSLIYLSFDSSDKYGNLKRGGKYKIETVGWRIPILSEYPNIIRVE